MRISLFLSRSFPTSIFCSYIDRFVDRATLWARRRFSAAPAPVCPRRWCYIKTSLSLSYLSTSTTTAIKYITSSARQPFPVFTLPPLFYIIFHHSHILSSRNGYSHFKEQRTGSNNAQCGTISTLIGLSFLEFKHLGRRPHHP